MKCGVISRTRSIRSIDGVKLPKPSGPLPSGEGMPPLGDGETIDGGGVGEALGTSEARLLGAVVGTGVTLGDGSIEATVVALGEGEIVSVGAGVASGDGRGVLDGGGVGCGELSIGVEGDGSFGGGEFGSLVRSGATMLRGAGASMVACAATATAFTETIPMRSTATNTAPDLRITTQILCQVPANVKGAK